VKERILENLRGEFCQGSRWGVQLLEGGLVSRQVTANSQFPDLVELEINVVPVTRFIVIFETALVS